MNKFTAIPAVCLLMSTFAFGEINNIDNTNYCYNDEAKIINCDNDFKEIPQPLNIERIEKTDFYKLIVINENKPDEIYYYICDTNGNKLIDNSFVRLIGAGKNIIAVNSNNEYGVYNSKLEVAIPFGEYSNIWYDNGRLKCYEEPWSEPVYFSDDFKPTEGIFKLGENYYFKKGENGLYYICDYYANILKDKGYYDIYETDGRYCIRSSDSYPRLYGLLDENFNEIIEEEYFRIYYDSETGRTERYINGEIQTYDSNNNLVNTKAGLTFLTPIKGLEGKFVYNYFPDSDTLIVNGLMGRADITEGVLNSDFELAAGLEFGEMSIKEENNEAYIESTFAGYTKYYDLYGNSYATKEDFLTATQAHDEPSAWAKESIKKAIEAGIVPEEIRSQYIRKITRQEFCKLAVMTYISKTNYTIAENLESPFGDVNDIYVTTAYDLNIVAGRGNGIFAPKDTITRQEAAVMLNNLAKLLNIEGTEKTDKFVDESYFADWAKDAVYSVASMKSGDTYVMAGTGEGKFSPWMNYTREQAIATMLRLTVMIQMQQRTRKPPYIFNIHIPWA